MATTLKARIHHKVDDEEAWHSNDPILIDGEIIISVQSNGLRKIKVGDGESRYSELPYLMDELLSEIQSPSIFVRGMIILWSGNEDSIPAGWALCNGDNGTPDLLDRFVIGAGASYSSGNTGGEAEHVLTADEMPAHIHSQYTDLSSSVTVPGYTPYVGGWTSYPLSQRLGTAETLSTGGGAAHNNLPPYYALCFIMKT